MEIAVWILVAIVVVVLLLKGAVGLNKKKARDAFLSGYNASEYRDLELIIERNSRATVTTFNIVSVLDGRALRLSSPNLSQQQVRESFDNRWSNNLIMRSAQKLEEDLKFKGKEPAVSEVRGRAVKLFDPDD